MNSRSNEERRRFFRIIDAVSITYRQLDEPSSSSDQGPPRDLISKYNDGIKKMLGDMYKAEPDTAKVLDLLNKKLDLFFSLVEVSDQGHGEEVLDIEEASLSACGIAFAVNESFKPDTRLLLKLFLKPSNDEVEAEGRVISCQPIGNAQDNYLRVEFSEMHYQGREKLIQHIVQRQGAMLKNLRHID